MSKAFYAKYSLSDFDGFDCLKISWVIFASLIFVLRGYLIWIMSVVNFRDSTATIKLVFPQPELFYLSLISGAIGLYIALVISLRRPDASTWVQRSWPNTRTTLVIALLFDFIASIFGYAYWHLLSKQWLLFQGLVSFVLIVGLFKHRRVTLNLSEFPQKLSK